MFRAQSIAIVGASREFGKVGHIVARNMLQQNYGGELYLVNRNGGTILGQTVFKQIEVLPSVPELAVLAVPADVSLEFIASYGHIIKQYVVLAAGFAEDGSEIGRERQEKLRALIATHGLIVQGPNCAGYIDTARGINATFLPGPVPVGGISLILQSGAIGSVLIDWCATHHRGLSTLVSLGNTVGMDESDVLSFLAHDAQTEVIGMYIENIKNGPRFMDTLEKATKLKPVVILKSGMSQSGKQAALSHTAGLAGDVQVFAAAVAQSGGILAGTLGQFIMLLDMMTRTQKPRNDTMLVVTNAGGCGVLACDTIEKANLKLVSTSHSHNPHDVRGDADARTFAAALEAAASESAYIGALIVIVTPQANTQIEETARAIIASQETVPYPIYPIFLGGESVRCVWRMFEENDMGCSDSIDETISVLRKITIA